MMAKRKNKSPFGGRKSMVAMAGSKTNVSNNQLELNWKQTFSPTILESKVPQKFLDIINGIGDTVLADDGLSKKWDFSDSLVGKVSKEVAIPMYDTTVTEGYEVEYVGG